VLFGLTVHFAQLARFVVTFVRLNGCYGKLLMIVIMYYGLRKCFVGKQAVAEKNIDC
jgi:hypothetical protein